MCLSVYAGATVGDIIVYLIATSPLHVTHVTSS